MNKYTNVMKLKAEEAKVLEEVLNKEMDSLMVGEGDDRKCTNLERWNVLNDILDELVNYSEAHAKEMLED